MRSALPVALSLALVAGTAFAATPNTAATPPSSGGSSPSSDQSGSSTPSDQTTPPATAPDTSSTPATPATPPASTPPSDQTPAPGASSAGATGANSSATAPANFQVGQQVQDNTGATIGTIASITGSGAQEMAVIKMGGQSFQVPASRLGVNNGAAEINLTQAQIATMLKGQTTTSH